MIETEKKFLLFFFFPEALLLLIHGSLMHAFILYCISFHTIPLKLLFCQAYREDFYTRPLSSIMILFSILCGSLFSVLNV